VVFQAVSGLPADIVAKKNQSAGVGRSARLPRQAFWGLACQKCFKPKAGVRKKLLNP